MYKTNIESWLSNLGVRHNNNSIKYNCNYTELIEDTLINNEGNLSDNGSIVCKTGTFTGRSPKDRFIVYDEQTKDTVNWNKLNQKISEERFDVLYKKVLAYLDNKKLYIRDCYACANKDYRLSIRVVNTKAWHDLFSHHLFIRPKEDELSFESVDFTVINVPDFKADPINDGTNNTNFVIINFSKKILLIAGTGYAGEIKKGIFSALNYLLPHKKNVLTMHCAANKGHDGNVSIFFGLSGTGKTTLSSDPNKILIGDDEHGWCDNGIFNFEGGCYAKTINLSKENEPNIFNAIKFGSIVENMLFVGDTRTIDYSNSSITENTRCAYPIDYINNAAIPSVGGNPKNIFFLTCDTYGVLPPISRLTLEQTMFYFILGYTAIVSGTEMGHLKPKPTFSACFGEAFIPLSPVSYAKMLANKLKKHNPQVWLINTGWTGGEYGVGKRIEIKHTRAMVNAAIDRELDEVSYLQHPIFKLSMPTTCPNVPDEILNPINTWNNSANYELHARELVELFTSKFSQFNFDDKYFDVSNQMK